MDTIIDKGLEETMLLLKKHFSQIGTFVLFFLFFNIERSSRKKKEKKKKRPETVNFIRNRFSNIQVWSSRLIKSTEETLHGGDQHGLAISIILSNTMLHRKLR